MSSYQATSEVTASEAIDQIDKRVLRDIFLRSNTLELSFNYEKMQALGFCYSLTVSVVGCFSSKYGVV